MKIRSSDDVLEHIEIGFGFWLDLVGLEMAVVPVRLELLAGVEEGSSAPETALP